VYKLVAVGGKIRGTEIVLNEGANTLGRAPDCDHPLSINGVSKQHMSITVNGKTAFVEDLGSSNGTFVNGKLTKKKTVQNGDKIALPNVIFQVVYVKEKKVVVKKKVAKSNEEAQDDSYELRETMPNDLPGKLKFIFKHRAMSVIYSFNEQYEWRVLMGILLFIFITVNIALTIGPVMLDSKRLLLREIGARGEQFAMEVARANAVALRRGDLDRINTTFLDSEVEGVQSYELFDLEGRIVRPISKLNSYVNDSFSIEAMRFFKGDENIYRTLAKRLGNGEIGIAKAILAAQMQTGRSEPVGIIAIRFKPKSLQAEAANNSSAYMESLITTSIVAVFFFGMLYYMTTKPLEEMRIQVEEVLRGKAKELESKTMFDEIRPLRNTINSILQRIKELQNEDGGEFQEIEDDAVYVRRLYEFMQGAQGPVMVLNSEKNIEHINPEGEDLTGMRESAASGTSLLDSARDQGFAATVIDLADQCANNEGMDQAEPYELTGKNYMVHVNGMVGKDGFVKAFYVTFVLDE
jgi:pSer/pThr/pTyr-binding forkhead associated (FHA) protein